MLARIDEYVERALGERVDHLGEPAGLREGDPLAQDLEGRRWAFEDPEVVPEVVVEQGDLAPLPGLGRELDRLTEVLQATGIPEVGAGHAAEAEGARGASEAELLGEVERPIGDADRVLGLSLGGARRRPPR